MKFLKQTLSTYRKLSKAAAAAEKLVAKTPAPAPTRRPKAKKREAPALVEGKYYPVGIVGERSYQDAISRLSEGQQVTLWHEPGNPYDDRAVAVAMTNGATIGYLARDAWLRDVLLDEGKPCTAWVLRLNKEGKATGVVIEVVLSGKPIGKRDFKRS
jgi:hypothetical protein